MSAEVEIAVAEYEDVLLIPVAAIVETEGGAFCWVKSSNGARRTRITLGDSDDVFSIITDGISEGDEVLLNPAPLEMPSADNSQSVGPDTSVQATVPTEANES
jgi:HlyD family secretion protein